MRNLLNDSSKAQKTGIPGGDKHPEKFLDLRGVIIHEANVFMENLSGVNLAGAYMDNADLTTAP
jgi:uncharacterized protein YjbI with pentapeptide repeats